MNILFKLINKYFWRGFTGPVFSFLAPMLIVFFIGMVLGPQWVMPGGLLIPVVMISMLFLPQSIFEFKNSTLLKRIGVTTISPMKFLTVIIVYNILVILSSTIFIFICSFAIFAIPSLNGKSNLFNIVENGVLVKLGWIDMISKVDWWSFIYSLLIYIIMAITIGFFISSIARSSLFIQGLGITIIFVSFFLAPLSFPIPMVINLDAMKYIGYLLPLKYATSSCVESFAGFANYGEFQNLLNLNNSSIWDINTNYAMINPFDVNNKGLPFIGFNKLVVYNKTDKILNIIMPYFFILVFGFFGIEKFSWSNRGKKTINWKKLSIMSLFKKKQIINNNIYLNDDEKSWILKAENIIKKFKIKNKEIVANDNISFEIRRGRNLAILGANGSGKTTLVEQIVGLNNPDSGRFSYSFKFNKTFHEGIGIQFQDSNYPIGLRCSDIIEFVIDIYGIEISKDELNDIIKKFGVTEFYNKNCSSLSGGQQQRLNLLLSIIHKPKLLFLDELSTGLDIKIRNNIKKFIKEFAKKHGITIVIVSHDMNEVEYLCNDLILLKNGKLIDSMSITDAIKKYKNLEDYVSSHIE